MEEINLKDLFGYFLSKRIIVVFIVLVSLVFGVSYYTFVKKPMYKSYITMLLTKESDSTTSITTSDINLSRNLIDTYSEIIKSRRVVGRVINNLDLDYSVGQLQGMIMVTSINDTEIIKISVVSENAEEAMLIANEIANVFNIEVIKLYNIQNIGVIDVAEEAESPYNMNFTKTVVLSLAIGIAISFGLVFVMFYFDNTIKSKEEVEEKLGLPVIGLIPFNGGER